MYRWILLICLPLSSQAFTVDSLMKVDGDNSRYFTIKNPDSKESVYLTVSLSEMAFVAGQYQEEPLKVEQFLSWPIYIDPAEIVVDPEGELRINVVKVPNTATDRDRIIGVSFIPDILRAESQGNSSVAVVIGYKSWYFLPGTQAIAGEPNVKRQANQLILENSTNKVLNTRIDFCIDNPPRPSNDNGCLGDIMVLAGSQKNVPLPSWITHQKVSIRFSDLLNNYSKNIAL